MVLLKDFEDQTFNSWSKRVSPEIIINLKNNLLIKNDNLLDLNFDPNLVAALKEVRYLKAIGKGPIPDEALKLFDLSNKLWTARVMLSRIVEWYNDLKTNTVDCEQTLIDKEMKSIDNMLNVALSEARWSDYDQNYIDDVHSDLKDLHSRFMRTKLNIKKITASLKSWGNIPLYERKDGLTNSLILPEESVMRVENRQEDCKKTKKLIDNLVDENFRLFFKMVVRPKTVSVDEVSIQSAKNEVRLMILDNIYN